MTGMTGTTATQAQWDVVVVGAGVAGLNCARELTGSGFSVLVLEASSRIGGRVRTHHDADGRPWELGAQVVHGQHNALWDELGVGSVGDSFRDTAFRCVLGGRQREIGVLAQLGGAPWSTNAAVAAMSQDVLPQSMSDWLGARALPGLAHRVVGWWMAQEWAAEPGELDCAELAGTVRSRPVTSEAVVAGGFATLPAMLAQGLHIELDSPVRQIDTFGGGGGSGGASGVRVRTDAGVVTAGAVVVSVPPWTIGADGLRIPELPEAKRSAVAALRGGDAVVAVVDFDAVCGHGATVFDADAGIGFVRSVSDGSSVQVVAKGQGAGRLRNLLADREALRTWLSTGAPWTTGAKMTSVHTADWGRNRYVRGAFTVPSRGSGAAGAAHAAPIGRRIFFAGESTCAATGVARVHGAFDSGRRAAVEVATAV